MEVIQLSIKSVFAHKLRSILTMLGIIIGIAAIICIFSIIQGDTEQRKMQLIGGSSGTMSVEYDKASRFDISKVSSKEEKAPLMIPEVSDKDVQLLKKQLHLKDISVNYTTDSSIFFKAQSAFANIFAIKENYLKMKPAQLIEGRVLNELDILNNKQVMMISEELYSALSKKETIKVGDSIEVEGIPFELVGIFKNDADDADMKRKNAYVPYTQKYNITDQIDIQPKLLIQTNDVNDLQKASESVAAYFNKEFPHSDYVFGIENLSDYQKHMEQANQSSMYLLTGIASISLLVGGIGVMNIMLVSITERTKEIGLKKALGAPRKNIVSQFLIESIVLTIVGGIIGIVLGITSGIIVTNVIGYPYIFSLLAVLGSLVFSAFIGILFGILPAIKASKLNPIQALRSE